MEKRINEAEFDEFEKLLGEIPNVTSEAPSKGNTNIIQLYGAHQEDLKLPDDQSLTSAFSEMGFNDRSAPLVYGQYPSSFDYLSSLGPSLQNSYPPDIGFQFVPNVPNVQGVEFPIFSNQQQFCFDMQRLNQPQMTWHTIDQDQYYEIPRPYLGMGMTPQHLMSQSFRTSLDDIPFNRLQNSFQEKMAPKPLGLNSLRNEPFRDLNKNRRVFSNNHNHRISKGPCDELKGNCLRPLLQNCSYSSIDDVVGRIYFMAKDQNGCRFLQRKFAEGTQKDVDMIFDEIIMHVVELMTDPFGNYLVQKLLDVCSEDQRMQIIRIITRKSGDLVRISCDMHGTRAVQKIVETLKTPEQFLLVVSSLKPAIVTLMKNINGNHVAQRCLQYLLPEYSEFLYEAALASCVELATDRHGCCVLQKCLSHCDSEKRHRLMCEITSNALILAQDQYGNYVVQFVLKTRVSWAILDVLEQLEGNYGDLSTQKYSSNVIEKCLKHAKEEQQSRIIKELITDSRFDQILHDPYGNYVIQAALKRSKATLHDALVEAIKPYIPLLRTSPYGKKVLQAIA